MKINLLWMTVAAFTALIPVAQAQPGPGMPHYDPKTEVSVKGTIEDVQQQAGRHGWMGTHLMLKTATETVEVHVGPSGYIAKQNFSFAKGDAVEVVGSKVTIGDKPALIAREITKEGKTLVLRDAHGIPQWSRRGTRNN